MNTAPYFKHTITYWTKSSISGYGKPTFAAPSTYRGRWEAKQSVRRNQTQQEIVYTHLVMSPSSVILSIGDYLYLGTSTGANPLLVSNALEVGDIETHYNINGSIAFYVAYVAGKK